MRHHIHHKPSEPGRHHIVVAAERDHMMRSPIAPILKDDIIEVHQTHLRCDRPGGSQGLQAFSREQKQEG
jgi:septum formation topological specificity factor MinE